MSIVTASAEAVEEIKKMLDADGIVAANLRIAARIDLDGDKMGDGYQMFLSELTLNDQYQEFDGFNIIVANILLNINDGFNLSCIEDNGKTRVKVTPYRAKKPGIYRGTALGTAAKS